MRRLPISLLIIFATACYASGQSEPRNQSDTAHSLGTVFQLPAATDGGCPVGLIAERRSDMMMLRTGDTRRNSSAHGLHITFDRRNQPQIESVEITVYGITSKSRILPAATSSSNDEVSKAFKLQRTKGSEGLQDGLVWMHKVGSLTRVELTSITYADGTTWSKSKSSQCHAVPSALLLISSK
jgi:hypothetical protein